MNVKKTEFILEGYFFWECFPVFLGFFPVFSWKEGARKEGRKAGREGGKEGGEGKREKGKGKREGKGSLPMRLTVFCTLFSHLHRNNTQKNAT